MRIVEISSQDNKDGRRKFKAILYRIYPDSCVDEVNQVGTQYNENGITWIRKYAEAALPSIEGMSIRCEFANEERTELIGHGLTDIVDDVPIYEDAVMIGTFTKGYIEDIDTEDGVITAVVGEGEIDASCYHNFCEKTARDLKNGLAPSGSVEIMHAKDKKNIEYLYGYKDKGRIPTEFVHSGYALLGVAPADKYAKLVELNKKHEEDVNKMNRDEITALIKDALENYTNMTAEINETKTSCEAQIAEANAARDQAVSEKCEIEASSAELQKALDAARAEIEGLNKKYDELYEECNALRKALGEAKAKERLRELDGALASFSDQEKEYAKAEIEAFNADPENVEINSVVDKIYEGIGKAAKAEAENNTAEQNSKIESVDIFSEITIADSSTDENIF